MAAMSGIWDANGNVVLPPKRKLFGTTPGLYDPGQPTRLFRRLNSQLNFASFDPRTAAPDSSIPNLDKLSLKDELYRPKRVVIETTSLGESTWRFVPKAQLEPGVENEGSFPRLVNYCGEELECCQEQWDIHKLDPYYVCNIRVYPHLSTIRPKQPATTPAQPPRVFPSSRRKRAAEPLTPSPDRDARPPPSTAKRPRVAEPDSSDDEDEVLRMTTEDPMPPRAQYGKERVRRKEQMESARKERRGKLAEKFEKGYSRSPSVQPAVSQSTDGAGEPEMYMEDEELVHGIKRKASYEESNKRPKVAPSSSSPPEPKRGLAARRLERQRQKHVRVETKQAARRARHEESFMGRVMADIPELRQASPSPAPDYFYGETPNDEGAEEQQPPQSQLQEEEDEAAMHQAALEESRRKIMELEADRPLWEAASRERKARERAEEEARIQAAASREREAREKAEAAERAAAHAARKARLAEETAKKEREIHAQRERERRQQQQRQRWSLGVWTTQRAFERYKTLAETFDSTKFSTEEPVMFETVPWPILKSPIKMTVEDIEWGAVEKFFDAVRPLMRGQDYKTFVETSHRRFHPDRWRSRRLLASVEDDEERGCLEVAANTVAQAITPIWRSLKGR